MSSKLLLSFAIVFLSSSAIAGDPEPPVPPGTGTMKSLQEIYDKLESVEIEILGACTGQCDTDAFIPRTGQTTIHELGDDGDLQKGVTWPEPRFTNNGDGTTTDNLTGLVWLRNNWCHHGVNWSTALDLANNLADGECNLTDGSQPGDWRLPNIRELLSLVDYSQVQPALPPNWAQFFIYGPAGYWSSTTWGNGHTSAWVLDGIFGRGWSNNKSIDCLDLETSEAVVCYSDMAVWAVRDSYQP
jgi:hypothetical protein